MSKLLIDIGNTCIHWAVQESGQTLSPMQVCRYRDEDMHSILTKHWSEIKMMDSVFICSVAVEEINSSIQQWLLDHWQLTPHFVKPTASAYGIYNAYAEPDTLGTDRWAAMVAAFNVNKNACCVLGCGTAVTFDVVASNGEHLGGWIMPGYQLFHQCLSQQTAGIEVQTSYSEFSSVLGHNTQQCVAAAWHQGVLGLTQRGLKEAGLKEIDCFITGGDAPKVLPLLGNEWCYADNLVLQGLAIMASQD